MLNPERVERSHWPNAAAAAHAIYSDPGTVAAYWLGRQPQEGSRWQRLRQSFDSLLQSADEGVLELTSERLVAVVRKSL